MRTYAPLRLVHEKLGTVYAYRRELDDWRESRKQLADVEPSEIGEAAEPSAVAKRARWGLWLVAATLVAGVSFGAYRLLRPAVASGPQSLAVLPFVNETGNPSLNYLGNGLSETVIDYVAQAPDLRVRPFDTSRRFRTDAADPAGAGRKMSVDVVLAGAVRTTGSKIQVKLALVDVASNAQIWAESYAVGESDLAATAQKIALAAREQILRYAHGGTFQPPLYHPAVRMTENPEAFREYLKGTTFGMNAARAPVEDGVRHLQESIRLDPGFGRAWSSLGIAHIAQTFFGDLPASQTIAQAKAEAKKALELDTSSYAGWRVLGAASHYYDWDHIAAEKQFLRSIELNPQDAGTLLWFAFALADMRRFDEALTYIKRASDADPRWLEVETCRGDIYYFMGKTDQAIAVYLRNLESQPNYGLSRHYLGRAYLAKGQFEEAIAQLRRGNELLGQVPFSAADLGYALAVAGHGEEADKMLAAMMRKREQGYYPAFAIALVHLGLGHIDLTLDWLERTVDERLAGYYFPWVDPFYNSVRSNPRFQKLMRQMNFVG